jgi:capsule polysaccharide export protein KpsC/LpsZ
MCCQQFNLICQQDRHVSAGRQHQLWYKSNIKLKEDKMLINWKYNNINVSTSSLFGIPYKALNYIKIWIKDGFLRCLKILVLNY